MTPTSRMKKLAWKTMLAISAQRPRLRCAGSITRRQGAGRRGSHLARTLKPGCSVFLKVQRRCVARPVETARPKEAEEDRGSRHRAQHRAGGEADAALGHRPVQMGEHYHDPP